MMWDTSFWASVGAILALLILSGFFSGSETALTAASRAKLHAQADKGKRAAKRALQLTRNTERLIGAVLLGNNLTNILAASLATALFTRIFAESGVALATLMMTALVLIFSELLPKTYAISNPETLSARVAWPLSVFVRIFAPFISFLQLLVRGLLRLFGVRIDPERKVLVVQDEIEDVLNLGHSEGMVEKEDRDRILGALQLGARTVEEIMVHRSRIEMIDLDCTVEQILAQTTCSHHTRLPVYEGEPENIVGVLHARDVLRALERQIKTTEPLQKLDLREIIREPYFVPETAILDDQMREFLARRAHFALVVDEYGVLQGLLTLEDILEEIVGDISDEFDRTANVKSNKTADGSFLLDGAMPIRDLNRKYDWSLPDEEAVTLAGLVIHEAQMIPIEGQVFYFHGYRFEVMKREANRLALLKLNPLE